MITLINGKPENTVPLTDRGFQYGDGLFETLVIAKGEPLLWQRHLARMCRDAARLAIPFPRESVLNEEVEQVSHGVDRGVLKIILTRGTSGRGYRPTPPVSPTRTVSLLSWPDYPAEYAENGIDAQFCRTLISRQAALAGIKHLNRLEQVLARAELDPTCAEGLMCDEQGHVIEGTMTNLFVITRDELLTPDLSYSGVDGVMRSVVLEQAASLSIPTQVTKLKQSDVLDAEEVFITNSLIGLWPVHRLGTQQYHVGNITRRLAEAIIHAHRPD